MSKTDERLERGYFIVYKLDNPMIRLLFPEYKASKKFKGLCYTKHEAPEEHYLEWIYQERNDLSHLEITAPKLKELYKAASSQNLSGFLEIPFRKREGCESEDMYRTMAGSWTRVSDVRDSVKVITSGSWFFGDYGAEFLDIQDYLDIMKE
jgi:hypothetical protein